MKAKLLAKRDFHLNYQKMQLHIDSYPKQVLDGSVKSLKFLLNSPELYEKFTNQEIYSVQGSFRKLEID